VYKNNNNKHKTPIIIKKIKEIMETMEIDPVAFSENNNNGNNSSTAIPITFSKFNDKVVVMCRFGPIVNPFKLVLTNCRILKLADWSPSELCLAYIKIDGCTFPDISAEVLGTSLMVKLSQLPKLIYLEITGLKFSSLPDVFGEMKSLEVVKVPMAPLTTEDIQKILKAPNLKGLDVSYCQLDNETKLYIPPNLEMLDVSGHGCGFPSVKYLLPAEGGVDFRLESLNVSGTSIDLTEFPFSCFKNLKELICHGVENLKQIPLGLANCPLLEKLSLQVNNSNPDELWSSMSDVFPSLKKLTELKLENMCGNFPKFNFVVLSNLTNLRKLTLGGIDCTTNVFPLAMCNLTKLTHLSVNLFHPAGISTLPKRFSRVFKLEEFTFLGAKFPSIPEVLFNMKTLTGLWLCDSPIGMIGEEIKNTNIATLHIREAKVEESSMKNLLAMMSLVKLVVSSDIHDSMKKLPEYQSKSSQLRIWYF